MLNLDHCAIYSYMNDDAVKEKIDEKYIILVRENDYLFLKKNTSIISVAKD